MTLTINSILENRYRIEYKLGQGGFGAVRCARLWIRAWMCLVPSKRAWWLRTIPPPIQTGSGNAGEVESSATAL